MTRSLGLFLLIFQILNVAWAEEPFWVQTPCESIQANLESIKQWTTGRSLRCELDPKISKDPKTALCRANVAGCLPPEVVSFRKRKSDVDGPNCWNLAMVMAGVIPALRYSTPEEMAFFMSSPLCKALSPNEKQQPGDIGAIRSAGKEVHGFMWVSNDLVFSKNGKSAETPYLLQNKEVMIHGYELLQLDKCGANPQESCDTNLDTIHCRSMESYLQDPKTMIPKKIQEAFIRMEHADKCLSHMTFTPNALSIDLKKNVIHNIQVLAAVFESPEFKSSLKALPKADHDFIAGSISVRLNAMYTQVGMISDDSFPCVTCILAARELRKAGASNK